MKNILALSLLLSGSVFAKDSFLDSVNQMKWGDLEVVWIEDDKFPKFTASIYFQDGAMSDPTPGVTQATFDQLTSGTKTQNQKELSEYFDFYGANLKHSVTHEYSILSVQALVRDLKPVMGKVCEVFKTAQFPQNELSSYASRSQSHLKNLVTSHSALADRIFRNVTLSKTPYAQPIEGTVAGFAQLTPEVLKTRLASLNKVKKILYLSGPKEVKGLEKVIAECAWENEHKISPVTLAKPESESVIYLVPVPGANQAQIRIGRYMTQNEVQGKYDRFQFLSSYMGGSFTSKLVQELRVKRGLTYSAGAYVSMQRDYGRAGIVTFSKSETAAETIALIRDVFQDVASGKITEDEFKHQQGHLIGGYSFGFEETGAFIGQLMLYRHQNRSWEELVNFPENIKKLQVSDLASADGEVFPWEKLSVVVVGDKSLEKSLSRIRPVKILDFKDFL